MVEPRWLNERQKKIINGMDSPHKEVHMWHLNSCNLAEVVYSGRNDLRAELSESERNRLNAYYRAFGRHIGDKD